MTVLGFWIVAVMLWIRQPSPLEDIMKVNSNILLSSQIKIQLVMC